jgi:uncharacterized membrane protein
MLFLDLLMFLLYFAPSIVAWERKHYSEGTIFLLNLCLGWTVIGWFVCLFWAWSDYKFKKPVQGPTD